MTSREGLASYIARTDTLADIDPTAIAAAGAILAAANALTDAIERSLRSFGMPRGEVDVLMALAMAESESVTPGDVADQLNISTGAMTKRLDGLVSRNLIERLPHDHDRRSVLLRLTVNGGETAQGALAVKARTIARATSGHLHPAMSELANLLARLVEDNRSETS